MGEATHRPMISLWRPNKTCAWQLEYGAYLRADLRRILATVARYRPGPLSPAATPRVTRNSSSSSSEDRRRNHSCPHFHPAAARFRDSFNVKTDRTEICHLKFAISTVPVREARDFLPLIARLRVIEGTLGVNARDEAVNLALSDCLLDNRDDNLRYRCALARLVPFNIIYLEKNILEGHRICSIFHGPALMTGFLLKY